MGMTEQAEQSEGSERARAGRRKLYIFALLTAAGVVLFVGLWLLVRVRPNGSVVRAIAAVNTAYALPPQENAATIYDRLIANNVSTGHPSDPRLPPKAIDALIEASKRQRCWFPLSPGELCYRDHRKRWMAMGHWAMALERAARRDFAIDRLEAAATKLYCLMRIGDHLRQQGLMVDLGAGIGLEMHAWRCLAEFVMSVGATEEVLKVAEAMPGGLVDDWKRTSRLVLEAQPLVSRSVVAEWSLRQRVSGWWQDLGKEDSEKVLRESYLHLLSLRRGVRLLVGIRRHYEANEAWPDRLTEIVTLVPNQAMIDPFTEQPFVYEKVAEDDFYLYSKGPNRIDENGSGDDGRIWPPEAATSRR